MGRPYPQKVRVQAEISSTTADYVRHDHQLHEKMLQHTILRNTEYFTGYQ